MVAGPIGRQTEGNVSSFGFWGWRGKIFHSFTDEGKIDMWMWMMMMTAASGPVAFELARLDRFGAKQSERCKNPPPSCRSWVVDVCLSG